MEQSYRSEQLVPLAVDYHMEWTPTMVPLQGTAFNSLELTAFNPSSRRALGEGDGVANLLLSLQDEDEGSDSVTYSSDTPSSPIDESMFDETLTSLHVLDARASVPVNKVQPVPSLPTVSASGQKSSSKLLVDRSVRTGPVTITRSGACEKHARWKKKCPEDCPYRTTPVTSSQVVVRERRSWTADESALLKDLIASTKPEARTAGFFKELARQMNRSVVSVKKKWRRLSPNGPSKQKRSSTTKGASNTKTKTAVPLACDSAMPAEYVQYPSAGSKRGVYGSITQVPSTACGELVPLAFSSGRRKGWNQQLSA